MTKKLCVLLTLIFFSISNFNLVAQDSKNGDLNLVENGNSLDDIVIKENSVILKLKKNPDEKNFLLDLPPRIVVDVMNCELNTKKTSIKPDDDNDYIKRVRVSEYQSKPPKIVRVVIDLYEKVEYSVQKTDKEIKVLLNSTAETSSASSLEPTILEISKSTFTKTVEESKVNVSEQESKEEVKKISESKTKVAIDKIEAKKLEKKKEGEKKSEKKIGKQDKPDVANVIDLQEKSNILKEPVPEQVPVIAPKTKPQPAKLKKEIPKQIVKQEPKEEVMALPKFLITLDYDDAEIPDVLQMLAIKSGINIIYGPDVKQVGTITINLRDVPFDKAFENILRIKGLSFKFVSKNIIRVATSETFDQEKNKQIVYTKIFPLNYTIAEDIKNQLMTIRLAEKRTAGSINVDKQTNSLIVTETEEGLQLVEEWIKRFDVKPYQVSIEAKLIDITLNDLSEMGVDWSYANLDATPGTGVSLDDGFRPRGKINDTQFEYTGNAKELNINTIDVDVGYPTSGFLFQFGKITDSMFISAKLAALITNGRAKVLSNPRITTMSNKVAQLLAGEQVPYKTTTVSQGIATETYAFLDAGIKLSVEPVVSPDKWITMKVSPEVSVPQASPSVGTPPAIKTRKTDVTVMVKDGETLVIGGLISDSDLETIKKVPLLGDFPILGYLFKYKTTTKNRSELVILITPRVVED